jgi:uncharacterized protein YbgA (DUF1722 family)
MLDILCPNEPQRKEIGETISLYRQGLLPLVSSKQILKMDHYPSRTPQKRIFWNIVSQEEFEAG